MEGKLMCGAGKACITPAKDLIPHLKGLAGQRFCKVLDDLFVRALVFSNQEAAVILVSFELDKVPYPERYSKIISASTGISEKNIMMFSIHTHCAPVTGNRPDEGPNDRSCFSPETLAATEIYEKQLETALQEACTQAMNTLQFCKIGWETGESFINVNRSQTYFEELESGDIKEFCALGVNTDVKTDHTVFVMKVENLAGKTIAILVNYAVHCCVMIRNDYDGKGNGAITSDLGGRVSDMLEKKYGGVAIWSSGAAGDINPAMMNEYHYPDPETGKHMELKPKGYDYALKALQLQSTRHMADIVKVIRKICCETSKVEIKISTGWSITPGNKPGQNEPGEDYRIRLRMLRIGNLIFAGVSGELYSAIGVEIQKEIPAACTVIINHESSLLSNAGYIYDDETLKRCGNAGGELPGMRETRIIAGYVTQSLLKICKELYAELI